MPDVELRPFAGSDTPFAYAVACDNDPSWIRVCATGLPTPPEFEARLWADVNALFVVHDAMGAVGVASLYSVDHRHGTCWADVALLTGPHDAEQIRSSVAIGAARHAFDRLGLRKVYVPSPGWQPPTVDTEHFPAETEATLTEHLFNEGMHWPMRIQALRAEAAR